MVDTGAEIRTEEFLLNMGPQHPSTHGVFRVVVRTDGELVLGVESHIGYLHRCFEKCAENNPWISVVPYTDRMDYLAAMSNNLAYSLAVEKIAAVDVTDRARWMRMITVELQRIASHLMAIGTYGLDVGAITPFLHCFRERERLLDIFEEMCGQRLNYSYIVPGGLMYDWPDGMSGKIARFCDLFEKRMPEYHDLLSTNGIFIRRTANVGILPVDVAISHGCTGPVLRGSGVARDLRKDSPYEFYDQVEFSVPVGRGTHGMLGDCWDRYWVRALEMEESLKIIRQCLDRYKDAEGTHLTIPVKKQLRPKKGTDVYFRAENPRGELGYYLVSDGGAIPYRVKARAPSFCNISVLDKISEGCMLADLVAIIGSLDIVLGEIDR